MKLGNFEINNIYNIDCLEGMKGLPNECINLVVTSPPYDDLRNYNGFLTLKILQKNYFGLQKRAE